MKTLSINLPDSVEIDAQEARLIIASKLFELGKLSLGEAEVEVEHLPGRKI